MRSSCAYAPAETRMSVVEISSDESLMARLREGEENALAELVLRYQNDVFRFCLHYLKNIETAKEMAQETFLRVYTARDRFDVTRKFKPWLLCIARNLCLNELKRKKTVHIETLEQYASTAREDTGEMLPSGADAPSEIMMAGERRHALMNALDALPDDAREIVVLRYFERMQARDIAELMDSTEGAIRTRLHRILRQLRDEYAYLKDEV